MLLEFFILCAVALLLFYKWSVSSYDFFQKRGVPHHKPSVPLFGSMKDLVFRKKSMFDVVCDLYNMHDGKVFGIFDQRKPLLLIRDPELIKQITIKDFDHFVNHRVVLSAADDGGIFGNSLFMMQDGKWKDMRSTLSPAFTGSKMRQMFELMNQVAQDTVAHLKQELSVSGTHSLELDLKDYFTRFTNDVIASTAFGLQVNSFENRQNEFYMMGKKLTNFTSWQNLKFFLHANFKFFMRLVNLRIFDKQLTEYFMHLVLDAMKYRSEHNISRPDMINMLMEAKGLAKSDNPKSHNREWSDIDIVAQCFLFFFAGFETSSVLMCFAAHELLENPEVQAKLLQEIEDVSQQLAGKPLTYEALQGMRYMDMVISEVLRKWPPAVAIDRMCNKDIVYEVDGLRVAIKKDEYVWLPLSGLHRDPKYFPNPEKFDPERFSEENKNNIQPFTYLPFGMGPRNCIGSRFALLEAKAMIFYLVRDFVLEPGKNTTIPMKLCAKGFTLAPENGFWLKLCPRAQCAQLI